jgi:hypothetical protein
MSDLPFAVLASGCSDETKFFALLNTGCSLRNMVLSALKKYRKDMVSTMSSPIKNPPVKKMISTFGISSL